MLQIQFCVTSIPYRIQNTMFCAILVLVFVVGNHASEIKVGEFKTKQHGVGGTVYIVDEQTLLIKGFTYDGRGPDAFFWAGTEGAPSHTGGTILPYPFNNKFYEYNDETAPIIQGRFNGNVDIQLKTPQSLNTADIKWLSVWCRAFTVDFGSFNFNTTNVELNAFSESEPETNPEQNNDDVNNHIDGSFETSQVKSEPENEPESEGKPETEGEPESEANPETSPILGYGGANSNTLTIMMAATKFGIVGIFLRAF